MSSQALVKSNRTQRCMSYR